MTGKSYNKKIIEWVTVAICCAVALVLILLFGERYQGNSLLGCKLVTKERLDEITSDLSANLSETEIKLNGSPIEYCYPLGGYLVYCADLESPCGTITVNIKEANLWISQPYTDSNNQTICRCIAENGDTYKEFTLYLTDIPVMVIETDEEYDFAANWSISNYPYSNGGVKSIEVYSTFTLFGKRAGTLDTQNGKLSFHIRGQSSFTYEKKSLRLHLLNAKGNSKQYSLLDLGEDNDWILNALYTDALKIRDQLSYEVWNCMAENTDNPHDSSSSLTPVELIINGRYLGVYGLQTVLDATSQQLNYTTDYLYYPKGTDSVTKNVTSSSNESESFDEFTVGKIISAPKDNSGNTWQPFIDYINAVLWDYYYTGKYDIELAKSVCDYENIIDFYLWRELTFASDNGRKNVYYVAYYDASAHNNLRFLRIPWDTNYTFGDCWIPGAALRAYSSEWATSNCDNYMDPICTCCYLADKDMFSSLLYERWQRLKSIIDAESLADRARTLYNDLASSGALMRDHNLYQINQTGNLDIDELCDAIYDRFDYMDNRINDIVTDPESEYWRQLEMLMNYVV